MPKPRAEKASKQSPVSSVQNSDEETHATSEWYKEQMKDFERNVIGTQEAADLLGVTQRHIELLIRRGRIQAKRIGPHAWAVYRPSLRPYQKSKAPQGKPPSNKPKLKPDS